MAVRLAALIIIISILIEISVEDLDDDIPLSKSLGYTNRNLRSSFEDERLSREYLELYQEMVRASRESHEKVDEEEARLETIVGREKADLMRRGVIDRRRSIAGVGSPLGRRRVRSQAARRNRLNSQSLRSHMQHIRNSGQELIFDN